MSKTVIAENEYRAPRFFSDANCPFCQDTASVMYAEAPGGFGNIISGCCHAIGHIERDGYTEIVFSLDEKGREKLRDGVV